MQKRFSVAKGKDVSIRRVLPKHAYRTLCDADQPLHAYHTCVVLPGCDDEEADACDREPDRRLNRQVAAVHRVRERAVEQEGGVAAEQQVPARVRRLHAGLG